MVPIQKSIRFFIMMFPALFALVKPVSTMANPQDFLVSAILNHSSRLSVLRHWGLLISARH